MMDERSYYDHQYCYVRIKSIQHNLGLAVQILTFTYDWMCDFSTNSPRAIPMHYGDNSHTMCKHWNAIARS